MRYMTEVSRCSTHIIYYVLGVRVLTTVGHETNLLQRAQATDYGVGCACPKTRCYTVVTGIR